MQAGPYLTGVGGRLLNVEKVLAQYFGQIVVWLHEIAILGQSEPVWKAVIVEMCCGKRIEKRGALFGLDGAGAMVVFCCAERQRTKREARRGNMAQIAFRKHAIRGCA